MAAPKSSSPERMLPSAPSSRATKPSHSAHAFCRKASMDVPKADRPPMMAAHAPDTRPTIPSQAAPAALPTVSQMLCRPESRDAPKPLMPETTASQAPVMIPMMAAHFLPAQAAIPSHRSFHHAAIPSQFWTSHAPAAIRPAMAMTTSPMGLALMAALSSHCAAAQALVTAETASMTPRVASSAAFQATNTPST